MVAVRGIDDILLSATLAVAFASLEEVQRRDGHKGEMEKPLSLKRARCSRKKRDVSMYMWLGAAAGR